jgi:hypothetical protein
MHRTDDLFHAMERIKPQIIDGTALTSRHSRQNRHNRRYLLPKCCQIQPAGHRADRVDQPDSFIPGTSQLSLSNEAALDEKRTHTSGGQV